MIYCINPWCKARENDDHAETCSACHSPLLINDRFRVLRTLYKLERSHDVDIYEALDTTGSYEGRGVNTVKILKVLKAFDERFIEIFKQEASILQALDHPALPYVDLGDFFCIHLEQGPDDLYCLAMSKIEGVTLSAWVKEHGPVTQELGLVWLTQFSEILDYVHSLGFIHRDVKPENIIVRPDRSLALIDFGFSQSNTDSLRLGSSRVLYAVRSFGYTAPEQNIGRSYPQSDIYALGRTLVFAFTGQSFSDIPSDERGNLHWHHCARQISKPFHRLIDRMMAPSIAKRPQDAYEILCILKDVLPRQIKWSRRWQSKAFRYGSLVLSSIAMIGLLNYSRLRLSEYYYSSGLDRANQGDYATARQNFNVSTWLHADEPAFTALARMCAHIGQNDCAKTNYEAAIKVNPKNESPWYNLATYYEDVNDLNAAQKTYQRALTLKKDDPTTLNNLARLFILSNKYTQAKKSLEQAEGALAGHAGQENLLMLGTIYKNQGWMLYEQRNYTDAKEVLSKAIDSNPNLVSSYCLLAQVNEKMNQPASEYWAKCVFPEENNIIAQDETLPEVSVWRHIRFNLSDKVNK